MNPEAEHRKQLVTRLSTLADKLYEEGHREAVDDLRQAINEVDDLAKRRWDAEYMFRSRIKQDISDLFHKIVGRETDGYEPIVMFTETNDDAGLPRWHFQASASTSSIGDVGGPLIIGLEVTVVRCA